MKQLISRWGKTLDKNHVLEEYPRPMMVRDSYKNLNGEWDYSIDSMKHTNQYDGKILVPFSPESYLSGVSHILKPDEHLHYKKTFVIDGGFLQSKTILHFGAVDQECEVYFNGKQVGEHKGGYIPFEIDVSDVIRCGENTIEVDVVDQTEFKPHARGKQKLIKKGKYGFIFYTPCSGIWKSVWIESLPDTCIEKIRITPDYDEGQVSFLVETSGKGEEKAKVEVSFEGTPVTSCEIEVNRSSSIRLGDFLAWTPDTPNLYDVVIKYGNDEIKTYFGMRKYSLSKDGHGIYRFFLNNKPFFFNGPLNQGYWPESLLTEPSDEALKYDIMKMKELGFNTMRCHVKVESDRFYYYCDKLGMAVWQDMPNGGGDYNMFFVTYLTNASNWFCRHIRDHKYSWFKREDLEGRNQYYRDLEAMINTLYNHPSIAVWVPFNEGWGQFDAKKATELIRKTDGSRLINEACGWFDQHGGDMYSIHNYSPGLLIRPDPDRAVALTEFGGYSYQIPEHCCMDEMNGYEKYKSTEELSANYKRLWEEEVIANIGKGLSASIYTQTTDIESEINGILTYDREVVKIDEKVIQEVNKTLYKSFFSQN